ncbi:MAG: hypothetical protein IJ512_03625 [Ruminococcus sp.]|nr:hypothetical protein [Ruminococcus sp.]
MPLSAMDELLKKKLQDELRQAYGKKVVAYPKFYRILWYVNTPPMIGLAVLFFCLPSDTFPTITGYIMCICAMSALAVISIACVLFSSRRIVYSDTEIDVTTLWRKKRHYNILDIRKASSTLYFYRIVFSDGFSVILTDSMTMSAEFYSFAKRNASAVKGKY